MAGGCGSWASTAGDGRGEDRCLMLCLSAYTTSDRNRCAPGRMTMQGRGGAQGGSQGRKVEVEIEAELRGHEVVS
jgi:hypothetical protein